MKKCFCLLLILTLLWSCAAFAATADGLRDVTCQEQGFSTKVPADKDARWVENTGFQISMGTPGYVPYVIVLRREKKLNNPVNYLNNVYREHMENRYNNDVGTNPCREVEIGGKKLYMAQYHYKANGNALCLALLIEVRDDGDVEYSAKFAEGKGDEAMAVLETAVRYYRTGAAEERNVIAPVDISGAEVNTANGTYWVKITDTDRIMSGGFFTACLYVRDQYQPAQIEALKAGDRVRVSGQTFTVARTEVHQTGEIEIFPEEEFEGYIVFNKEESGMYTALVNDWTPATLLEARKIMMPLPNDFSFGYIVSGGSDVELYDADAFISLLTGDRAPELNQYNTMIGFHEGLPMLILHTDYPAGPQE